MDARPSRDVYMGGAPAWAKRDRCAQDAEGRANAAEQARAVFGIALSGASSSQAGGSAQGAACKGAGVDSE